MQNIQDKEFDQVFKSKFEEAEVEPSSDLWGGIESKLERKRNKVIPIYWLAAAVSVLALTAGILFYPSKNKQNPTAALADLRPANNKTEAHKIVNGVQQNPTYKPVIVSAAVSQLPNSKRISHVQNVSLKDASTDSTHHLNNNLIAMQPVRAITHPDHRTIGVKQEKLKLPEPGPDQIVLANANTDPATGEVSNENGDRENKGIRNVGDLINLVVDKLDKREDKAIQFETDDDNSSLVSLNIGIIKFNRKRQK